MAGIFIPQHHCNYSTLKEIQCRLYVYDQMPVEMFRPMYKQSFTDVDVTGPRDVVPDVDPESTEAVRHDK